eukprot:CAMPEP_0184691328 /NCGR_PEP_ID=MMETSP0313-20130426/219_1 /TAXON_ID=2792 /ORGANISM="Porphyridium aerugineum, Strain SAG 1380-2" /LENGTH=268 /DNA_ID=CAMNT_0027149021 /DNA_START=181 /DNA_END=987 /DNA_ORIENTATION=-
MDAVSSSFKQGKSAVDKKRELDKSRREILHNRLVELHQVVEPYREGQARPKKWDKEMVLGDAIQVITTFADNIHNLEALLATAQAENVQMAEEKNELRNDKQYLKAEIEKLRAEVRELRIDNVALWRFIKDHGLASSNNPQTQDSDGNGKSTQMQEEPEPKHVHEKPGRHRKAPVDEPRSVAKRPKLEAQGVSGFAAVVQAAAENPFADSEVIGDPATPDLGKLLVPGVSSSPFNPIYDFFEGKTADLVTSGGETLSLFNDDGLLDPF